MASTCRQATCPLERTGKCLEGLEDPTTCPNYGETDDKLQGEGQTDRVALRTADALAPEATYELTRAAIVRTIVFAGEPDCGKTTLLASLYDAFQDGPVGELQFGGSVTLHGFEQRCHGAREVSGLSEPKTERTKPAEGFRFLHLRVWNAATAVTTDLLLGDMSGELYRNLRDSSDECRKYDFLRRADHFIGLLDGEKIAGGLHAEAFGNLQTLVRALIDAKVLGRHSLVTLLTTKWDLVEGSDECVSRVAGLNERFRKTFANQVKDIVCSRVAARPASGDTPMGLDGLLRQWLGASSPLPVQVLTESAAVRAFDRYCEMINVGSRGRG